MEEAVRFSGDAANLVPPSGGRASFCGLNLPASAFVLSEIIRRRPGTYLVYLPTPIEAEDFVRDLEYFWPEGDAAGAILLLPGYEVKPFAGESPASDLVFTRLWALWNLLLDRRPLVVAASAPGALQLSMPKRALSETAELLEAGEEVDRDLFIQRLVRSGYYGTSLVQSQGDFSVRGGILDIYPPGAPRPVRAEFFGDQLESLRTFQTSNQRSKDEIKELVVLPASEAVFQPGRAAGIAESLRQISEEAGWLDLLWGPLVEGIEQEQYFPGLESFLPLFYDELSTVQSFAGPETISLVYEPDRFIEAGEKHLQRLEDHLARIQEEERPHLPLSDLFQTPEVLLDTLEKRGLISVSELDFSGPQSGPAHAFSLETNQDLRAMITGTQASEGLLAPLAARLKSWLKRGLKAELLCHTREQAARMAELLQNYDVMAQVQGAEPDSVSEIAGTFAIKVGWLSSGFVLGAAGRAFVTEDELFGPKRRVIRRAAEEVKGIHLSSFQDLQVGDIVVHEDHGLGQYLGLVKLEAGGRSNDYLHLSYKGGDKLYVPVERFGAVGKYVGAEDKAPALDRLGGTTWERVKARVKASIREMADELLKLYARRQLATGHAYSPRDSFFREFEASFPYEETPDQMSAIEEVLTDLGADKPMDRLVCGDVGYGKTEVAVRAAFKAVGDGKQVAVLVPTTVLAEQHYQTFVQRLTNYPIEVDVLSRFKKPAEQREILKRLASGRVDVIVGTHRLLSKDVAFKDLGLLVIDEEHRFGVAAKEKLKKLRTEVDVLSMSATPIPRTLSMSLSGIRDLSVIQTPPQDRLSVKTYLLKYDETTVCEAIARELDRGGQVFFVHNRVKDIGMVAGRLQRLMPLVKFGVAHGQQKEAELEAVMLKFLRRQVEVLVTTTIIESGLDFPTANTIIINNADRFGLAQMYQLRGRVGRSTEQAYAYLLVASAENLTRDARKRLRALLDFSELGAGYKVALHDLQIRGAGNLLGAAQSGQIAAVGYEMYVSLMEQAVRDMRGEEGVEEVEPEMVLGLPAYIPESYVPDTEQRLIHYRRVSSIKDPVVLEDAADELVDRYGPMPPEVENLLEVMELKYWLKKVGAIRVEMGDNGMTATFGPAGPRNPDKVISLVQESRDRVRLSPEGRLFLPLKTPDNPGKLIEAKNILQGLV